MRLLNRVVGEEGTVPRGRVAEHAPGAAPTDRVRRRRDTFDGAVAAGGLPAVRALLEGGVHVGLGREELVQDLDLAVVTHQRRELVLDRLGAVERETLGVHTGWDGRPQALFVRVEGPLDGAERGLEGGARAGGR